MAVKKLLSLSAGARPTESPAETLESPLGFITFRSPQQFPATNVAEYGVVVTTHVPAVIPPAFTGVHLRYRSAITCQADGDLNIDSATAVAENWAMRDSGGNLLTNSGYGGVLGDPGNVEYQEAWCQAMLAKVQESGSFDGFWADDATPTINAVSGGVRPAAYATNTLYGNALTAMAEYVKAFCDAEGLVGGWNAQVVSDNTGSLTVAWIAQFGPHVDYFSAEYWMTPDVPPQTIRKMGTEWYNAWDGWRQLHPACQAAGCSFQPLSSGVGQTYVLATYLLDWDGTGQLIWSPLPGYQSATDPWIADYADARALGMPTGAATLSSSTWTRVFEGGQVQVNPVAGTASIT